MLVELSVAVLALHTLPILSDYAIHSFIHSLFNYFFPSFTHYETDMSTTNLTRVVVSLSREDNFYVPESICVHVNFYSCVFFQCYIQQFCQLSWVLLSLWKVSLLEMDLIYSCLFHSFLLSFSHCLVPLNERCEYLNTVWCCCSLFLHERRPICCSSEHPCLIRII